MKKRIIISLICLVFSSCAVIPTQEEMSKAYYGPYPTNYKFLIKDYMELILFDNQSAVYRFGIPYKGYAQGWMGHPEAEFGWVIETLINAKNRFGGYVGFNKFYFVIRDGQIIHYERDYFYYEYGI